MPFCNALTNHMCITVAASWRPCCRFNNFPLVDINQVDFKSYQDSDFYKSIKSDMFSGWSSGCKKCKEEEERGQTSLREVLNKTLSGSSDIEYVEISLSNNCNLRCVYCQNYQISQTWKEQRRNEVSHERLAEMMIELQGRGCHNIGFVSPTHFAPQMARAVLIAHKMGLRVPIVYNTNAYDSVEALSHLENVVDIYLPDLKYSSNEDGFTYSKVRSYRDVARSAIREMHRQAGSALIFGEDGLLKRGLVIRLLVLPNDLAGLEENLEWIASELGNDVCISLMAQYYPTNKAATDSRYILMSRRITESEWARAVSSVEKFGFTNGFVQEYESSSFYYRPDFSDSDTPFKDIRDFS